jgi:hypothetical protein
MTVLGDHVTPDFSAQFRPRDVWDNDTMLHAWWWAMYWPWTAIFGQTTYPSAMAALMGGELSGWLNSRLDERVAIGRWWP